MLTRTLKRPKNRW